MSPENGRLDFQADKTLRVLSLSLSQSQASQRNDLIGQALLWRRRSGSQRAAQVWHTARRKHGAFGENGCKIGWGDVCRPSKSWCWRQRRGSGYKEPCVPEGTWIFPEINGVVRPGKIVIRAWSNWKRQQRLLRVRNLKAVYTSFQRRHMQGRTECQVFRWKWLKFYLFWILFTFPGISLHVKICPEW